MASVTLEFLFIEENEIYVNQEIPDFYYKYRLPSSPRLCRAKEAVWAEGC